MAENKRENKEDKPICTSNGRPTADPTAAGREGSPIPRLRGSLRSSPIAGEANDEKASEAHGEALCPKDLAHLHILRRVSIESVWGLLEHCPVRKLEPAEVLLAKGQSNQTMYMIISGRLRVHLDSPESEPLAFLDSGQTVGEISVIDDSPVTAYVVAAAATRLLAVGEETFWRLVAASHEFAANLLLLLAQRMRANNFTILENSRLKVQFERDSRVDALTSLYNRRWLNENLPRLVQRYQRGGEPLSLLMLDIDHFKRFNDECGHAAGDRVLSAVAQVVREKLRPTDLAARYGGEEFVVVLTGTDLKGACSAAERLRDATAKMTIELGDGRRLPSVTISLGAAEAAPGDTPSDVLGRADQALYRAKAKGRNRVDAAVSPAAAGRTRT
jgi:diguanylate cyclase (GGDEF)-like protein